MSTGTITDCAASLYGQHDYSLPPHNTPDAPRDAPDKAPCQVQAAGRFGRCAHERQYEVVVYQIASHDWIRLYACEPCAADLRQRHRRLGPGGSHGIARVCLAAQ